VKFEITILGCGSAVPTSKRNCAAQVLNVLERYFLIDCGEGTQYQMRRFGIPYNKINNIFISHLHGDHFFGLVGFLSTLSLQGRRGDMHIYADSRLQKILDFTFETLNTKLTYKVIYHNLSRKEELIYEDNILTIIAFPVSHRYDAPCTAFAFKEKERARTIRKDMADAWNVPIAFLQYLKKGQDFVTPEGELIENSRLTYPPVPCRSYTYITDTLCIDKFLPYARYVDLLYHEATFGKEFSDLAKKTYHSTAQQAAKFAKKAGAKKLIIGHFSSRYPQAECLLEETKDIFPHTFVCHDGDVFEIEQAKRYI